MKILRMSYMEAPLEEERETLESLSRLAKPRSGDRLPAVLAAWS